KKPIHEASDTMDFFAMQGVLRFFIKDQRTGETHISCERLEKAQRSLDDSPWQSDLKQYAWDLIRPPRIQVFYANDVLALYAEMPESLSCMKARPRQERGKNYLRALSCLIFPNLVAHLETLAMQADLNPCFSHSQKNGELTVGMQHRRLIDFGGKT